MQLGFNEPAMIALDNKDPSQADGFQAVYSNQLPFHIRIEEGPNNFRSLPNTQILNVKVLVSPGEPTRLKIELTCDNDLYFNFSSLVDERKFLQLKEKQKFYIQFREYAGVIIKNLQRAEKEPSTYQLLFSIFSDLEGRFDVVQRTEFKNYEILSFDFRKGSEFIRDTITFRYNLMKRKIADMALKLQEIDETVKAKNPSLLLQIRKKIPALVSTRK